MINMIMKPSEQTIPIVIIFWITSSSWSSSLFSLLVLLVVVIPVVAVVVLAFVRKWFRMISSVRFERRRVAPSNPRGPQRIPNGAAESILLRFVVRFGSLIKHLRSEHAPKVFSGGRPSVTFPAPLSPQGPFGKLFGQVQGFV